MQTCNGCIIDQPNQLAHMGNGGCLNSKEPNFLLCKLNKYMLTDTVINKYSSNKSVVENENKKEHTSKKHLTNQSNIKKDIANFTPYEKDKLFWCFYIFLYGYEEYEMSKKSSFVIEKNFKIKTVEQLSSINDKLKELKLKSSEIQDDLINQPIMSIKSLQVFCLIYDISIIFIKDKTFYEIIVNDKPIKVILNENNKIYIPDEMNDEKITYYRNNYWKIDNISKPLNGFSSYSLTELQDICNKLEIPITTNGKKIQKKDLYQQIISKI